MNIDEIIDDLKERFSPFCDEAAECIERLQHETKIAEEVIKHLHSENTALRKENEQQQVEINFLKKKNNTMTENRRFLLDDITAMLPQSKDTQWLTGLNDDGLFHLWKDLVNLTLTEDLT